MYVSTSGIYTGVYFHPVIPLVSLPGLVHLGITLAALVLSRARCIDDRGVYDGATMHDQPRLLKSGIDISENLLANVMFFQTGEKNVLIAANREIDEVAYYSFTAD